MNTGGRLANSARAGTKDARAGAYPDNSRPREISVWCVARAVSNLYYEMKSKCHQAARFIAFDALLPELLLRDLVCWARSKHAPEVFGTVPPHRHQGPFQNTAVSDNKAGPARRSPDRTGSILRP